MLPVPASLQAEFENRLRQKKIPRKDHGLFKKWLRYYLDFCKKYRFAPRQKESLSGFLGKLREKKQTQAQQKQAACAVEMFYEIVDSKTTSKRVPPKAAASPNRKVYDKKVKPGSVREASSKPWQAQRTGAQPRHKGKTADKMRVEKSDGRRAVASRRAFSGKGASWEAEFGALANEIKVRHYSPKTLRTYRGWVRKFQAFTKSKPPLSLSTDDVKAFLTFFAVKRKVSASTQNQAFNALLFFFRHVLGKECSGVGPFNLIDMIRYSYQ